MAFITRSRIWLQIKADLIGKDSYRGVTLTYAWLANQFGHVSLGFIPTLILYVFLKNKYDLENPIISSIIVSFIWLVFEICNFLLPLFNDLKNNKKGNLNTKKAFKPDFKNVGFDTFTDVCFFTFGAFLCGFFLVKSGLKDVPNLYLPISFATIVLLTIVLFFFSKYWYVLKMYQQYANYPFQFRLSQFNKKISDENIDIINNYKEADNIGNHLLIFGGNCTGKTSLAVGLANELSIKKNACFYTTAFKLFTSFFEGKKETNYWQWFNCEYLIIDDINPGEPITNDIVSPSQFLSFLDGVNPMVMVNTKSNREILKNKNVIWILGNDSNKRLEGMWEDMLGELKIPSDKIKIVSL